MADKIQLETFQTPAGEAVFPWLSRMDTQHDASGVYHTDLALSPELAEDFIAKLERIRDEFCASLPQAKQQVLQSRPVYKMEMTRPVYPEGSTDTEKAALKLAFVPEPTGNLLFRFKLKASVQPKVGDAFTQAPVLVMADTGAVCTDPIYGGSIIKIRGQVVPYTNDSAGNFGVTLRMKAVQVLDIKTGSGTGSAHWTDFDETGS